ncbi:MAG: hypothetical protein EB088_16300 [Betaproteobacteria bacterium]|nr:hypothetical protein [Betaproteobacteria bacterium]
MGTRSLTYVYEGKHPVVCLYRQYDGYPSGHGAELAEFLDGYDIVNGFGQKREKLANGMGCLAAQMVAHFKTEVGNFYLHAPVLDRDDGQDFEYHVYEKDVIVFNYRKDLVFKGSHAEFAGFCNDVTVSEEA